MYTADFWLSKYIHSEEILCAPEAIQRLNQLSRQLLPKYLYDLAQHPAYVTAEAVAQKIQEYELPQKPGYINGKAVTADYFQSLCELMNFAELQDIIQIEYGLTLRRTNVRSFPTADFFSNSPEDCEFDRFQETALDPAEALVVLHYSTDKRWAFIQASNYHGWVTTDSIAVTRDRCAWLKYIHPSHFLIVTGNRLILGDEPHLSEFAGLSFAMGAKIPLVEAELIPSLVGNRSPLSSYVVRLPIRDKNGGLDFRMALIPRSADVHYGYLPYSRANVLRQAFKLYGDRYGWGGLFGSRDCSALVLDVFRSVGIMLARNAGEQAEGAGTRTIFKDKSSAERIELLRSLPPGCTLHFPGHVMLYLGEHENNFYVIHAIASCGDTSRPPAADGTLARMPLNSIMVTDLNVVRTNGKTLLESLTEANTIP